MEYKKILLLVIIICLFQTTSFLTAGTNTNWLQSRLTDRNVFEQPDSNQINLAVDSSGIKHTVSNIDTLSATPTLSEINKLFLLATQGKCDPFRTVLLVASKKDNAIPALKKFLFQPPGPTKDTSLKEIKNPNKQYAIYALDAIGSQSAENALITTAQTNPDMEIRGLALKTLANNFYYRTKNAAEQGISKGLQPNKGIVYLLLENADDTTYIAGSNEIMGKIAREGIKNWTGDDLGEIPSYSIRVKEELKLGMIMKQYRENWWKKNNDKIVWNKNSKKFDTK